MTDSRLDRHIKLQDVTKPYVKFLTSEMDTTQRQTLLAIERLQESINWAENAINLASQVETKADADTVKAN